MTSNWYSLLKQNFIYSILIIGIIISQLCGYLLLKNKLNEIIDRQSKINLGIVKVHYYTNLKSMTDNSPNITAWNKPIREGMIAVSRDMLQYVTHNDTVTFLNNGEMRTFTVGDKMHYKHKRSIDIFIKTEKYKKGRPVEIIYYKDGMKQDRIKKATEFTIIENNGLIIGDEKDYVYMPKDKVWITKKAWKMLNTTYYTRLWVKGR